MELEKEIILNGGYDFPCPFKEDCEKLGDEKYCKDEYEKCREYKFRINEAMERR